MKKVLFLAALLMLVTRAAATDVDLTTARTIAVDFLQSNATGSLRANVPVNGVRLLHTEPNSSRAAEAVYYIFNSDQCFVIVSGDDRVPQILAYGDHPLEMNRMPDNMRFWLGTYKDQIEFLQSHPGMVVEQPTVNRRLNTPSIAPLLTAKWAQKEPYYNQCPIYDGKLCVTGCPATSLSMVFYYWKYPTAPTQPVEGYMNIRPNYEFEIPALPSVTFDWDNMLDQYTEGAYTTTQADAVAWLMRYIGQVEQLQYSPGSTGGKGEDILRAAQFFGYDESVELVYKSKMDVNKNDSLIIADDEWSAMLQNELKQGRPVVYSGYHREWIGWYGHAFNVDGYKATDDTYHVNWGSSGNGDGYFVLNSFIPPFGTNYNVEQQMLMGIQPPAVGPAIKAHRDLVYLKTTVGSTATGTFTVKGQELTGDVTLSLNDATGLFSIDVASVPAAELENGKVITVSYAPQAFGDHMATITLSSPGAEDKTVTVVGKAVLDKHAPVMLPADSSFINLTQFRADWTDETPDGDVESYTLNVYTRPEVELIDALEGDDYTATYAAAITLTEPWNGVSVSAGDHCVYFANWEDITGFDGFISYTVPEGFSDQIFSVEIATISWHSSFGTGSLCVKSEQTEVVDYTFSLGEKHTWLVTAKSGEKITIDSPQSYHSPYMNYIRIYAGDITQSSTTDTGDDINRLIPGITDKFYNVDDLPSAGTYVYKVKARYIDGTESAWSNRQTVTLFDNGAPHGYQLGDVNHDEILTIKDVTDLINYLLGNDHGICTTCADVRTDGNINIADVTALIDKLLSAN